MIMNHIPDILHKNWRKKVVLMEVIMNLIKLTDLYPLQFQKMLCRA